MCTITPRQGVWQKSCLYLSRNLPCTGKSPRPCLYLNKLPARSDFKIGSTASAQSKMSREIFDNQGIIRPLQAPQMNIRPKTQKVDYFGRMYTIELVREAKRGRGDFELFMELHRRAAKKHLKDGERYEWDSTFDNCQLRNANALFLRNYDRKWSVYEKNGNSYVLRPGEIPR
jgi:hypothetical protein